MTPTTIDIHILQTVPPSNINRDDTGSPKTAVYGGVRRSRVSSQAWKRATRLSFIDHLDKADLGVRTKRITEMVAEEITRGAPDLADQAVALAADTLRAAKLLPAAGKAKKGESDEVAQSQYLQFLSHHQVARLAELAVAAARSGETVDAGAAQAAADTEHSVDVALFGRMVADAKELTVDAAAQVAHAISVHAAETEYDYFTALDDRAPDDSSGASMIGTVEFTSSTLYRYATVNVDGLRATLGDEAATQRAIGAFLRAFITSMPTGKQNSFANRTLPDAVVVSVRAGQSINLVGAFEDAVVAEEGKTRLQRACERLAEYAVSVQEAYGTVPLATFVVQVGASTSALSALGSVTGLDGLVDGVLASVDERVAVGR